MVGGVGGRRQCQLGTDRPGFREGEPWDGRMRRACCRGGYHGLGEGVAGIRDYSGPFLSRNNCSRTILTQ